MKFALVTALVAVFGGGLARAEPPRVEVLALDGYAKQVLAPHRGRRFAVNFWATWCDPCREELPSLLAAAAAKKMELVLVSLDRADRPQPLRDFLSSLHAPGSWVVTAGDPQPFIDSVDRSWDGTLPLTLVYDRDGRVARRLSGATSRADFERAFK